MLQFILYLFNFLSIILFIIHIIIEEFVDLLLNFVFRFHLYLFNQIINVFVSLILQFIIYTSSQLIPFLIVNQHMPSLITPIPVLG